MPQYDFRCSNCDHVAEYSFLISESQTVHPLCTECGEAMNKTFIASNWRGQIVMKGEWPGKVLKENRYRARRSKEMGRRQRERYGGRLPTLAPNVGGERVDNWGDAKKLAKEKGHNVSDYDQKVANLPGKRT